MKARLTILLIALVIGGPVLAEHVHALGTGVLVFAWMLGISGPGTGRPSWQLVRRRERH